MDRLVRTFGENGFVVIPDMVSHSRCDMLLDQLASLDLLTAGTRCLLNHAWCRELVSSLRVHPMLSCLLPPSAIASQCTYFDKNTRRNWLVPWHQDLSIAVASRSQDRSCTGWSEKEGVLFTQPPIQVLESLVAMRVHLDASDQANGPLRVVSGSHRLGRLDHAAIEKLRSEREETCCLVPRGGVLAMRPLLLHASSKMKSPGNRRVLHFLLGPSELPAGLQWHRAIA